MVAGKTPNKKDFGARGVWSEESCKAEDLLVLVKENSTAFSLPPELSF